MFEFLELQYRMGRISEGEYLSLMEKLQKEGKTYEPA